jgi:hypothetical protein
MYVLSESGRSRTEPDGSRSVIGMEPALVGATGSQGLGDQLGTEM